MGVIYQRYTFFNWTDSNDTDGDSITYTLNITCFHTSGCSDDNRFIQGITDSNYTLQEKLKYFWDDGYRYNWSVLANDGYENSSGGKSQNITLYSVVMYSISPSPPEIDFGLLNPTDTDDTTDDNPTPFVIQSDGNSMTNMNITADMIWDRAASPSSYYMFKADNETDDTDPAKRLAANWSNSTITWKNMPDTNTTFLDYFNWSNATDTVELDIAIEVPPDEPAGDKYSWIRLTGWYVKEV